MTAAIDMHSTESTGKKVKLGFDLDVTTCRKKEQRMKRIRATKPSMNDALRQKLGEFAKKRVETEAAKKKQEEKAQREMAEAKEEERRVLEEARMVDERQERDDAREKAVREAQKRVMEEGMTRREAVIGSIDAVLAATEPVAGKKQSAAAVDADAFLGGELPRKRKMVTPPKKRKAMMKPVQIHQDQKNNAAAATAAGIEKVGEDINDDEVNQPPNEIEEELAVENTRHDTLAKLRALRSL
jgi:hypothetical protein